MNTNKTRFSFSRGLAVAMLATVLLVGTLTAAYAADVGGLRRNIQIWMHGEAKDATVEFYTNEGGGIENTDETNDEGTMAQPDYVVTWTDENGETHEMAGGGVAIESDGTERSLTMDEYLEQLEGSSEVLVESDGRVMLYWYDIAEDITDRFEDGVCRLTLTHGDETMYFTVTDEGDGAYNLSAASDGYAD
ncbi:MAG: hypothetical protein IJ769_08360 [Clostridia bacterium]|nr:hypothetical protein [Clostridia bacterium]